MKIEKWSHIRVRKETRDFLNSMVGKRSSVDETIMWLWGKLSKQARELNEWKRVSGWKSPKELEAVKPQIEKAMALAAAHGGLMVEEDTVSKKDMHSEVRSASEERKRLNRKLGLKNSQLHPH